MQSRFAGVTLRPELPGGRLPLAKHLNAARSFENLLPLPVAMKLLYRVTTPFIDVGCASMTNFQPRFQGASFLESSTSLPRAPCVIGGVFENLADYSMLRPLNALCKFLNLSYVGEELVRNDQVEFLSNIVRKKMTASTHMVATASQYTTALLSDAELFAAAASEAVPC